MLTLAQDDGRRIWVILDELPTLHQVPSLQPGLAESRQFGGCFVLGVQVASALRDLYGRNGAETISGLCGTRVVLAAPDRDTAQWSADSLGRSEIEEVAEGYTYGANTIRDGVSLTPRRELRALALPSEIMRLANLEGYLKFPGPFPVASIRLKYVARPAAAERFVPREGDGAGPGEASATARPGEAEVSVPEPPDPDEAGPGGDPDPHDMPPEPAAWQGELDLVPVPGEARDLQADAAAAETAAGKASAGKGKAPDADGAAAAQTPQDSAPDAGSEVVNPPRPSDAGGGRGSDWY